MILSHASVKKVLKYFFLIFQGQRFLLEGYILLLYSLLLNYESGVCVCYDTNVILRT